MTKTIRYYIGDDGRVWAYQSKAVAEPPDMKLHAFLRWILEQLNFGNDELIGEGDNAGTTVVIGREASGAWASREEAQEDAHRRLRAVDMAGIFARARDRGISPEHSDVATLVQQHANESGRMNTEFYYAFQLIDILKRISERTFVFDAPAIAGRAAPHTLDLLQDATRCYLFGLYRACVAACRTVLEDSLNQRVPAEEVLQQGMQPALGRGRGHLELLIEAAARIGVLPVDLRGKAHSIRMRANDALHQPEREVGDPWDLLLDTREIVEELHSHRAE